MSDGPARPKGGTQSTPARTGGETPLFAGYWAFGQYWGAWVVVVHEFLVDHGFSQSYMGWLYAALAVVSIGTMVLVAPRLQRRPLAATLPASIVVMGTGVLLTAASPSELLWAPFVVMGAGNGLLDVFMNVAAQDLETRTRRPILQRVHAGYSVGGVTGGLGAGIALTAGVPYRVILLAAGVVLLLAAAWNRLRPPPDLEHEEMPETRMSLSALRRAPVLVVPSLVVLFAFLVEGSMDSWSGISLRRTLAASALAAGVGFAAFAGAMAIGRFFAARVLFRLGYRQTIMLSGLGSMAAGIVIVLTESIPIASAAYLLLGFSLASAAPAAFGLVEAANEHPTNAIAAITTVGYSGFVFAPPLLGWLGDTFTLRATMSFMILMTIGVAVSGLLAPRGQAATRPGSRRCS